MGYTYKKDVEEQENNLVRALNESLAPDGNHDEVQPKQSQPVHP
jgi:hypothetical protein